MGGRDARGPGESSDTPTSPPLPSSSSDVNMFGAMLIWALAGHGVSLLSLLSKSWDGTRGK